MSVFIYLLFALLVVYHGSILVVELVVYYLIVIGSSYHFDYPHKSHDVLGFCLYWSLSSNGLCRSVT